MRWSWSRSTAGACLAGVGAIGANACAEPVHRSLAEELKAAEHTLHAIIADPAGLQPSTKLNLCDEHEILRWFLVPPTGNQANCN